MDSQIGRFTSIDPHAENYFSTSPFTYVANNPLKFIDPDGKDIINVDGGVKFTGEDAQILFKALTDGRNEYKAIHFVREDDTPQIYNLTLRAFQSGKPEVLHYDSDQDRRDERREQALKNTPYIKGVSRDQYPYASTEEGGEGAIVDYVPKTENNKQGGQLSALYSRLESGDAFLVLPVPKKRKPGYEKDPVPVAPIVPKPRRIPLSQYLLKRINPLFWLPIFIPYTPDTPNEG